MTELTCILCPKGCRLQVDEKNGYAVITGFDASGVILNFTGCTLLRK